MNERWIVAFQASQINTYLAHKQHLLPGARLADVVQVARDIVALHATDPTGPYLSLWARVPAFERSMLEDALYERRALSKTLCMRVTLHALPSDELPLFLQAFSVAFFARRNPADLRVAALMAQAGLCQEADAEAYLEELQRRVLEVVARAGAATVQEISRAVPELQAKIRHSLGKRYEGEFSIGSRLVLNMCAQGLLVRTRPRGTWRSSLYEYAALRDWLPGVDPDSVSPQEAQTWLARHYLAAFGPATRDDMQWWTGLSKGETTAALSVLKPELAEVGVEGWGDDYLMLADDVQRLGDLTLPNVPYVFLLPTLDPYIMGYRDRRRFLSPEQRDQVFDRAGNAVPTVWVNGRVAGAWGQRKDGGVVYRLFEAVGEPEQTLLAEEAQRLEEFLEGEFLPPRFQTPFTRTF
jgi:hypothetical protein